MTAPICLLATPGYERDLRRNQKRNPTLTTIIKRLHVILLDDPTNRSRKYGIKKLKGIPEGKGQWRIRAGEYRLRYDIFGTDVVLYSFRHRKEAY